MLWTSHCIYLPLIVLSISCNKARDFKNDYLSRIELSDKIEVTQSGKGKSIIFIDKAKLKFLKDVLEPENLVPTSLTDDMNLPIHIILYLDNKIIGEMGIQFGHIQYIYYKGGKSFDYKKETNKRMDEFINVINQANIGTN